MKPVIHQSSCAIYNEPAYPAGPCDCAACDTPLAPCGQCRGECIGHSDSSPE